MDTMGKLETKWETGRDQGGWTEPCLLHMMVGHHSLVSSQSLHLCPLASEITGVLKWPRLGTACPSTTPALRYPPDPSMTKPATMGSKDCHHSVITLPISSFWFLLLGAAPIVLHPYGITCNMVSLKKSSRHSTLLMWQKVILLKVREESKTSSLKDQVWKLPVKGN